MDKTAIRDAATVIVLRRDGPITRVLMGQRGENAAFMPSKFVFPGGAVDAADTSLPDLEHALAPVCRTRLSYRSTPGRAHALAGAAIRELWEDTGLRLARRAPWPGDVPPDWTGFAAGGFVPDASRLSFVFRAITPPGRPRRFDARFFLTSADALTGDPDDFTHACDELSHLQWVDLSQTRALPLPFITEVVLAEIAQMITDDAPLESVAFFDNDDTTSRFERIA